MTSTSDEMVVDLRILGPLSVILDGRELQISTRRMRALMVLLLLAPGRALPAERLIDQLWDGAPPPQAAVTLRSYISNLRQALGGPEGLGRILVTRGQGYAIEVPASNVDAFRLATLATRGRELLRHDQTAEALASFEAAVDLWTGDPLADIADHEAAQSTITQLNETYLGAVEGRFEALLRSGRHLDAIPELDAFVAEHPLREGPRSQLMLALYRSGRAADALAVHQRFRVLLNDELGIDPSAHFDDLQQKILNQDPDLDLPTPSGHRSIDAGRDAKASAVADPTRADEQLPPPAPSTSERRLVGRETELASMVARLDTLTSNRTGSLLLLAGEPGIGKTSLLESLERRATTAGVPVHVGRTPAAVTGAPPFWLWTQIVESIAAGLDDDELREATSGAARSIVRLAPGVADRLGQALPMTGDNAQALRFLLYEAVSAFIRQATHDNPTVCMLDDIHWADGPSLELLSYLTGTLSARPLLIAAAYRNLPSDRGPDLDASLATVSREDNVYEITVPGLSLRAVEALIFDTDANSLPPITDTSTRESVAGLMHDRTGGNPFFIRQLARLLAETRPASAEEAFVPLPAGVRHVISSRLNALSAPTREILEAAALMGRDFEVGLTGRIVDQRVEQALDAFDEAARHGLIEVTGAGSTTRRFAHALVQETIVDALPRGRASKLHATIAAHLESTSGAPEILARHMWEARDVVGASAVPSQLAAADSAAQLFAYDQAETHLRRALDLVRHAVPSDPSLEAQLLLRLFRLIAADRGWGDADALGVVDRARGLATSTAYDDDTAVLWWSLFFALIDRDDIESYVDLARSLFPAITRGSGLPQAGPHAADLDADGASEAMPHADVATTRDDDLVRPPGAASAAAAHLMNVFRFLAVDDRASAEEQLQHARERVDAAELSEVQAFDENLHVMLLLIEGYWACLRGDVEKHLSTTGAAVALADADGRPFPRAVARSLAAVSASYVASPAYVGELASAGAELNERYGFGWLGTVTSSVLAWASAHAGESTDEAAQVIEDNLATMIAAGRLGSRSTMRLLLADIYALGGRLDDALNVLDDLILNPGPYQGLFADHVARRRAQLASDN